MALGDMIASTLELIAGLFDGWNTKKNNESLKDIQKAHNGAAGDPGEKRIDAERQNNLRPAASPKGREHG